MQDLGDCLHNNLDEIRSFSQVMMIIFRRPIIERRPNLEPPFSEHSALVISGQERSSLGSRKEHEYSGIKSKTSNSIWREQPRGQVLLKSLHSYAFVGRMLINQDEHISLFGPFIVSCRSKDACNIFFVHLANDVQGLQLFLVKPLTGLALGLFKQLKLTRPWW